MTGGLGEHQVDVVVAGAGPAGSAAAATLARAGLRVRIFDKARFPRDKCCGDGLTTAALRRVEALGLRPEKVASWQPVPEVAVVATDGSEVNLPLPRDGSLYAVTARRFDLDAALVNLAADAGADVVEETAVESVRPIPGGVTVSTSSGEVHARYVIAADGMWSPLRRALGLTPPGYLGEWQAGRQYLRSTGPLARKLWVWFEPDMIPGYAWSFPLPDGRVNFGYGVLRGCDGGLRGQAIDWRERPSIARVLGPDAEEEGPWRAWPIPARISAASLSALDGRVLFAGDAAGACDPMTGEGIAQALETAEMAAQAIALAGPLEPGRARLRYERRIGRGMAVDDRLAGHLARVLARPGGSVRALSLANRNHWTRRNFARWMFEDYPRALLATPHRWRRGVFGRPGAFGSGWSSEQANH